MEPEVLDIVDYLTQRGAFTDGTGDLSTLANPSSELREALMGTPSASGATVNITTAMRMSSYFGARRIITEDISKTAIHLYERQPNGKRRATEHPLYAVVHDAANEEMAAETWRENATGHIFDHGNTFSWIDWDRGGRVKGLYLMDPARMQIWRGPKDRGGKLYYVYRFLDGSQQTYTFEEILNIPGPSRDGIVGMGIVDVMREAIGLGLTTEQFGATFFANGTHYGGWVLLKGRLENEEDVARLRRSINDARGAGAAHKWKVLEEGAEIKPIGIEPDKAQFLATRNFQVLELCRATRLGPHKLGVTEGTTSYASREQAAIDHVVDCLLSWYTRMAGPMRLRLLTPKERLKYFLEFDPRALLQGDMVAQMDYISKGVASGLFSPNKGLSVLNEDGYEGGDVHVMQAQMTPVELLGMFANASALTVTTNPDGSSSSRYEFGSKEERKAPEEKRAKVRGGAKTRHLMVRKSQPKIAEAARAMVSAEVSDVRAAAEEMLGQRSAESFNTWLNRYYRDFPETVKTSLGPVLRDLGELVGANAASEVAAEEDLDKLQEFLSGYLDTSGKRYAASSRTQLQALVRDAEDALDAVNARLDEWDEKRADKVATRESVELANSVAKDVWRGAAITAVMWVNTSEKSCPYCTEMDGTVVGIEVAFADDGATLAPDGAEPMQVDGAKGHPPLHQGCECELAPA